MHNARLIIDRMEQRQREHAQRNRHAWKRPLAPKQPNAVRRAMAGLRGG